MCQYANVPINAQAVNTDFFIYSNGELAHRHIFPIGILFYVRNFRKILIAIIEVLATHSPDKGIVVGSSSRVD